MAKIKKFLKKISRKKTLSKNLLDTKLNRCLSLFDLVLFGVGNMVGAGIFVVTGNVLKNVAGAGVIISFIFAGFASFLSAMCYAEFGARVPKAGSAYTYTYITIGELIAFIIGWNILLESLIGAASVAKAWSGSLDVLLDRAISNFTLEKVGSFNVPLLSSYLDFVAFGCLLFWMAFVAVGVKCSSGMINFCTITNVLLLVFIMGVGFYFADLSLWKKDFLPFGFKGVVSGSASCFYAYAGFETIVVASEEAKNPSKNIPLALSITVCLVTLLYLGASISLTLMIPYNQVDIAAPFPAAIQSHGLTWATTIIAVGTLVGLSASLIGGLFGMPRAVYSMASDGLIFDCLGFIHPKTQTPIFAIIVCSIIAAISALLVDLEFLVELLSIGTLLCFIIVAVCVILIRYQPLSLLQFELKMTSLTDSGHNQEDRSLQEQDVQYIGKVKKRFSLFQFLEFIPSEHVGPVGITSIMLCAFGVWAVILYAYHLLMMGVWWVILLLVVFSLGFLLSYLFLFAHEENRSFTTFQTPFVPLVPVASITINIGLMLNLNGWTWLRLAICVVIGLLIYLGYGLGHSKENERFSYQPLLPSEEETILSAEQNGTER